MNMNFRKKVSSPIGLSFIIICAVVAGLLVFQLKEADVTDFRSQEAWEPGVTEKAPDLDNSADCQKAEGEVKEEVTGPFHIINENEAGGIVTVSGKVATRTREHFGNEKIKKIFLKIPEQNGDGPAAEFYSHFSRVVERGNTVNMMEDDSLLFALGELNDNAFSSSADVSSLAEYKIGASLGGDKKISLKMQVPVWLGSGAPSDFTFACSIEAAN